MKLNVSYLVKKIVASNEIVELKATNSMRLKCAKIFLKNAF